MTSNIPVSNNPQKNADSTALDFMTKMSGLVFFFRPSIPVRDPSAPELILLATWMDARNAHIAKYVIQYQALYPTSSILLIRSSITCYLSPDSALKDIEPAVHLMQQELSSVGNGDTKPRLLVHMFSNGGSCMIYHLYHKYTKYMAHSKIEKLMGDKQCCPLPRHMGVYDSAPGGWGYRSSTSAVLQSIPAGIMRQIALPFVYLLGAWWWVKYRVLGVAEDTVVWGLTHNGAANKLETSRVYFYSEADKMIDFHDVETHIDDATAKGFIVTHNIKLRDSDHVAHARRYPELYWGTIREAWNSL
jgi:hypothetical protein